MEEINFLDLDLSLNVDEDVDVHTPATDSDRDIHPPTAGFDDDLVTESDGARARTPQFNSTTDIDNTSDTADSENDAMRNMAAGCSGSQESRQRNTKTSTVWHGCWEARYQSYFCDENQEIREDDRRRRFASAGLSYYRQGGQTKCFRCGVILTYHSGHDPVITHAHLSPDCEFLRLEFGQSFMDFVTELSQTENVSELTESDVYRKMTARGIPVDRRNEDYLTGMSIKEAQRLGFTLAQINGALRTLRERSKM